MKKNLISIGILALLIVNLVLTGIMMFSVMSTNKKTAALVTDIASAIKLELSDGTTATQEEETKQLSIADIATYTIADMTIPLKTGADGKDHFAMVSVALSMNTTSEDYQTYGPSIAEKVDLLRGQINSVISQYTMEEAKANSAAICNEILLKLQALYNSDFIFDVTFSSALYQ
ncbi:MAG: flagellar basal body-associated FliL family protein [Lachnospiraceae bacterium]|nr:flagellar basal body-associated FliL family protein [Lachnospiraceae bacterium]